MSVLLEVKELVKHFRGVRAVDGISFTIARGTCFGLLGPNGAGKTTTVEIMEGIKSPTRGEILYKGTPLGTRFRNEAGIMFQSTALQDYITTRETLQMFGRFYRKTLPLAELIESCSLQGFLDRDNRKLSGGQRQRLLLAIALVNDPEVMFLDEPTTGLDPQARRNFWDLVHSIKGRGKTIILTTHYMDEAYTLCDEIAIMDRGVIIAQGTPKELLEAHFNDVVLELPREDFPASWAELPITVLETRDAMEILTNDVNTTIQQLLALGISLSRLQIRSRNLEDLFLEFHRPGVENVILQRFTAVLVARNREFLRDRSSLAWNILFPVLIVLGFAFAFSDDALELYKVGVYQPDVDVNIDFMNTRYVEFIPITDLQAAIIKVERHQLDMLISPASRRYWVNDTSPRGYMLERVLWSSRTEFAKQLVSGEKIRYVDWIIPGVLAMNMMFSALFGVGYVIVRYRKNGVLKRLKATPLTALEFLAAQIASRLWLIIAITALIFIGTNFFIDFRMFGSYLNLLVVFTLGAISLISLGMVVAARTASEEFAGGLLNLISWPMMFLSGVWFSVEGLHPWLQKLALALPLTHLIDAARAVMIDGAGLLDISSHLLALVIMTGIFLAIGAFTFRWES